jgi:hypothetical protein
MDDQTRGLIGFGEEHFGAAELGDVRRTRRLVQLADAMVKHPGGTLPDKLNDPASLKALYRLAEVESVTYASVLAPSCQRTLQLAAQAEGTVLHIHDGTELDYSGLRSLKELGHIGNGGGRGYLVHNTLTVVAETREVLGLAYQKLIKRPKAPKKETKQQCRDRPDRESRMWKNASMAIPPAPPGRRWVEVADRGADVLEFIDHLEAEKKSYLVRSRHNRLIALENGAKTKLYDHVRALPEAGTKTVEVPATPQHPARTAQVGIRWAEVTLLIPKQPRGEVRGVPLKSWVICVREHAPPPCVEPVEWMLLTSVAVQDLRDALERIGWYECRWMIENAFYVLTTTLTCELKSNCYPRCALFLICMAMLAYNLLSALGLAISADLLGVMRRCE